MSNWTPEWAVSIDGFTATSVTLANLTITSGRTDIFSQPQAGHCTVQLINLDNTPYDFNINTTISISVKDTSGTFVPIFGGWITDLTVAVQNAGSSAVTTIATITALGAISRLQRIITDGVLSQDYEGNQIYDLLDNYLYGTWANTPASLTWATYSPTTTWANAQNSGLGEIDMPGNYEMTSRSSSPINLYTLVSETAQSAFGYIYEDGQGRIGYADSTHRQDYLAANGYTELSANAANFQGISTITRWGDIRNALYLTYDKDTKSYNYSDTTSQNTYGVQAQSASSRIKHTVDAESLTQHYIALRAYPYANFQSITYQLANNELTDSERDELLNIFMGQPIQISNLPANIAASVFQGYVEGWTFRATKNALSLTLTASPLAFSQTTVKWEQVSASETWNTITSTLTWENAIGAVA